MEADRLPPPLRAQLDHLLTHSTPSIKVHQLWSGSNMHGLFDRFTLLIPYCLQQLRWDVIYNAQSPLAAPDIIFPAEDEPFNPFILRSKNCNTVHQKDILRDWVGNDPSSLLVLINELREQYRAYQKSRTQEVQDDRLAFEISTMLSREGIEIYVKSNDTEIEEARFAVPLLAMNINNMVVGCIWKCAQKIYLGVVFPCASGRPSSSSSSSPPQIRLVATSGLRDLLSVDDVSLPAWLHGMCMAEYIPDLEENLEREILRAVSAIDQRRRFIEVLATVFGWPIQTDSVFCRKAVFHLANGTFTFLVYFELPPQFPVHSPIAVLQSSMCMNSDGSPIRSTELSGCPWSPRWDVYEMTERMRDYLADEALNFKKHCMQSTAVARLIPLSRAHAQHSLCE